MKFLLIEDNKIDRMVIGRLIKNSFADSETVEAECCKNAVEYLKKDFFDCIILDYILPDCDGISLTKQIRSLGYLLPIVITTGSCDDLAAAELIKSGAQDYVRKKDVNELLQPAIELAIKEAKLLIESKYYKTFYEDCPIGFFTTTIEEGEFINANKSMLDILEVNSMGETTAVEIHKENPEVRETLIETAKKNGYAKMEFPIVIPNGKRKWLKVDCTLCEKKCQKYGKCLPNCPGNYCLFGSAEDITDRKELESKVRELEHRETLALRGIRNSIQDKLAEYKINK